MLGKIKWARVIAFLSFITIVLVGMSYLFSDRGEVVVKKNEGKVANEIITNVKETPLSEYPGLQLFTETTETDTYTTSISTPLAKNEQLDEPIHNWLAAEKETFIKLVEEQAEQLAEAEVAHLNIQLSIKKAANNIYSLVFTSYAYTGGADEETTLKSFTLDMKDNAHVQLNDVVNLDEKAINQVKALTIVELEKDEETFADVSVDRLEEVLQDPDNWKWSLSKEHFTLHFNGYEIAPESAGEMEVNIAVEQLGPHLKETIVAALDIKVAEEINEERRELDPKGKYVALTFDDGPSGKVTPRILQTLKEYDARATFFMLGSQVEFYPDLVERVAKEGHEVANHSKSHPDLTKFEKEFVIGEIEGTNKKIEKITGKKPTLFRPPYGAMNQRVKDVAKENDMSIILWSVDSVDWKNRDVATMNNIILKDVTDRSVVLMHDIHAQTADALPSLLAKLKKDGYEFVTVSELLQLEQSDRNVPFFGKMKK